MTPLRRRFALCVALVLATGGLLVDSPTSVVRAADPAWVHPISPAACTPDQRAAGDVATCVIPLLTGMPEDRGWPKPPFPTPTAVTVLTWVDLAVNAPDHVTVAKVQAALNTKGYPLTADGYFGPVTQAAVKKFQTDNNLPSTGIVNKATADLLGVQLTTGGVFPPPGWTWLGWGYNGSAALASFEKLLVPSTKSVGTIPAGAIRSFAGVRPLFEAFLAEIQQKGYVVGPIGGNYVFRCTATAARDCKGRTYLNLSNHAYGMAVDINPTLNPMQTNTLVNGVTACQTSVTTNVPHWVVQVAEKWGLYWGGYGWSSGCTSLSQFKTSINRDPMHFEFNGTVDEARAILLHNYGRGACFDVADTSGAVTNQCLLRNEVPAAGLRSVIDTAAPAGTAAALVEISLTGATTTGYVTAESCGPAPTTGRIATANVRLNRTVTALTVVNLDTAGRFCLFQSGFTHSMVDVVGFFAPTATTPTGALYLPVPPSRVLDTRSQPVCDAFGNCMLGTGVQAGVPTAAAVNAPVHPVAIAATVTAWSPQAVSSVMLDACDQVSARVAPTPLPNVSANPADAATAAWVVARATGREVGGQTCLLGPAGIGATVDVQGVFAAATDGGFPFRATATSRVLDTRKCWTDAASALQKCNVVNAPGAVLHLKAPAGAAAVAVAVSSIGVTGGGTVSVDTCTGIGASGTATAIQSAVPGLITNTMVFAPVGADGTWCLRVGGTMHVVVDQLGWFGTAGTLGYVPVTPVRVHDSRPPA